MCCLYCSHVLPAMYFAMYCQPHCSHVLPAMYCQPHCSHVLPAMCCLHFRVCVLAYSRICAAQGMP